MASPLETTNASSHVPDSSTHAPTPESSTVSASDLQAPSASSTPCDDAGLPNAEGGKSSAALDEFLNWDPWGDDSERYPGGFWNQNASLPLPVETQESLGIDQSEATTVSDEDLDGDKTTDDEYEDAKEQADERDDGAANDIEEDEHEASARNEKECTVCLDTVATDRYPDLPHTAGSQHSSDVCLRCWYHHLECEMKAKGFDGVSCPQCSQRLTETGVRKLANRGTYDQYLDEGAKGCMQKDEEFQACPSAKCHWGAFFVKDDGNIFNCQMCALRWCLSCDVPFHEGQTCSEHIARKKGPVARRTGEQGRQLAIGRQQAEQREKKLVVARQAQEESASLRAARPCPSCKAKIVKDGGCDHMTCKCGHEFCWLCLAPYDGPDSIRRRGNIVHRQPCNHWRG